MNPLRLAAALLLLASAPAFAGDLNGELKKSQTGMKKFFDPYEKKLQKSGPQDAKKVEKKVDAPKAVKNATGKLKLKK